MAFSMIGAEFCARAQHYPSIFGDMGSSVFPDDIAATVVLLNSARARRILESLNPGMHFQVGDVNRLPRVAVPRAGEIFQRVQGAFLRHEAAREPSIEFRAPGPSAWRYAQRWAQAAADRPDGAPLPAYEEELDREPPAARAR